MPNIDDAIAALTEAENSASTETTEETTEATEEFASSEADDAAEAATEDTTGTPPAAEEAEAAPPEPDVAALKRKELEERVKAVQARKEAALERSKFKAELQEFERAKAQLTQFHEQLRQQAEELARSREELNGFVTRLKKQPVAALKDLGIDPALAYESITNEMLKRETPESKEEQLLAKLKAQLEAETKPKLSKVEELEKRLAQYEEAARRREEMELAATHQAAAANFLNVVHKNGYSDLADYYEEDQLVHLGNLVANEFISAGRGDFTFDDVAKELTDRLNAHLRRAEEARKKRQAASQSTAAPAATPQQPGQVAKKPATTAIGNDIATATAVGAATGKPKSRKELLDEAAREISNADIYGMLR